MTVFSQMQEQPRSLRAQVRRGRGLRHRAGERGRGRHGAGVARLHREGRGDLAPAGLPGQDQGSGQEDASRGQFSVN